MLHLPAPHVRYAKCGTTRSMPQAQGSNGAVGLCPIEF